MNNIYEQDLGKNSANYAPLTPLNFLERCASVYPEKASIIHGDRVYKWSETYQRSCLLASALKKVGVSPGDTVSFMGANTPETYEAHFGVPMSGAVLNALNIRLDSKSIAFILDHAETKVLFTDREFSKTIKGALDLVQEKPLVIDIDDRLFFGGELIGDQTYEEFLKSGDQDYRCFQIEDEWQAIALNYTSGTSGKPKGVVYHHRGSYLMTMGTISDWQLPANPSYLYTVPLFHCNGWGHAWTMTALGGKIVCCRQVSAEAIYDAIYNHNVTYLGGAPIILGMIMHVLRVT